MLLAGLLQWWFTSGWSIVFLQHRAVPAASDVPETPELLCPASLPQGELKTFQNKSSQFLPCLIIFSFSSGFLASQPPRSHKASTNQLGSWVYFKHKDVRFFLLISWKHRNYCNSRSCSRGMKEADDTKWMKPSRHLMISCIYQSHP